MTKVKITFDISTENSKKNGTEPEDLDDTRTHGTVTIDLEETDGGRVFASRGGEEKPRTFGEILAMVPDIDLLEILSYLPAEHTEKFWQKLPPSVCKKGASIINELILKLNKEEAASAKGEKSPG